jgi:uncharacterized membrane protein
MPAPEEELRAISDALAQLQQRQRELEARVASLEMRDAPVRPAQPPPLPLAPVPIPQPPPPAAPPQQTQEPIPAPPPSGGGLETTVGLNWVNRVAVVTLILGTAFFFKYAADNGWIGPGARVLLGLAGAIVALLAGDRLWRRGQTIFAQGITGLGIALFYLSFYAAASLYQLISPALALILMSLVTIGAGRLALLYEAQAIAALGMIGGYLSPLVLYSGEHHAWMLGYVFVLNLGALALSRMRRWMVLEFVAAGGTLLLWYEDANRAVATLFALAFYGEFAFAGQAVWMAAQLLLPLALEDIWSTQAGFLPWEFMLAAGGLVIAQVRSWASAPVWVLVCYWLPFWFWSMRGVAPSDAVIAFGMFSPAFLLFFSWVPWRLVRGATPRIPDLSMLAGNAALYFVAAYATLNSTHHEYMGLLAAGIGALHLLLGWRLENAESSQLALGVALAFVTLAMPIQFAGFRVTVAWALEGAALAWIAKRYDNNWLRLAAAAVLALTILRLALFDAWMYPSAGEFTVLLNARFLAFAVSAAALWLTAWFLTNPVAYVAGHVVMLFGMGLEVAAWVLRNVALEDQTSVQDVSISILMTVYALALVGAGVATRTVINRILGLGLAGLVVAKLYLLDVWVVGRIFRVTAFLALGALLLAMSFLYSRFKPAIERWWKPD